MTKKFTVNIGGQAIDVWGPDNGTQEQAQEQATRLKAAEQARGQARDVQRDFSGEAARQGPLNPITGKPIESLKFLGGDVGASIGRKAANFAQGGAELVGGPAQLMGAKPGPLYQQGEKAPTDFGDTLARIAGSALPLAPLTGAGVAGNLRRIAPDVGGGMTMVKTAAIPAGAMIPRAVGAVEGASAPADSESQRVVNTGIGALTGGFGRGVPGSSALDRLMGGGLGMLAGHFMGGPESMFSTYLGGKLGSQLGPQAHQAVAEYLRKFPPSVIARAIAQLGHPVTKMLADQYDAMHGDSSKTPTGAPQQ